MSVELIPNSEFPELNIATWHMVPTVESFEDWFVNRGKSRKSARNYWQAVNGTLSKMIADDCPYERLTLINEAGLFADMQKRLRSMDEFKVLNKRGKGMYSAALNNYSDYIDYITL